MRILVCGLLALTALAGCLSDDAPDAEGDGGDIQPTAGTRPERHIVPHEGAVTGFGPTMIHDMPSGGQGVWIHEGLLYWTDGSSLRIVDVSDPAAPQDLGSLLDVGARDVDVLEWKGVLYAVLAGSGRGMHLVDVSDPMAPTLVTTLELPSAGVHNLAAVPGTPYIYSSGASASRQIDVMDITDPRNPTYHTFDIPAEMNGQPLNSDGCHDITVRADLGRAYCAGGGGQYQTGGGETFLWDITPEAGGPTDPRWISFLDDDRVVYNHQAMVNDDGTVLIVDDENLGPNCVSVDVPTLPSTEDPKVPFAAAWIWDISNEEEPRLMGLVQNDAVIRFVEEQQVTKIPQLANCGSHFGDVIPGTDKFVMGWYGGGTILVDYQAPEEPVVLDYAEAEGSTWDAQYWNGHVFHASGDLLVTALE